MSCDFISVSIGEQRHQSNEVRNMCQYLYLYKSYGIVVVILKASGEDCKALNGNILIIHIYSLIGVRYLR